MSTEMALVFRNYIGPKSQTSDINFTDVPIYQNVNFHFLLAFARDYDKQNFPTNGKFSHYWNENNFGPSQVNNIVGKYPNVKVFLTIGSRDDHFPFNVTDPKQWIEHAVTSVKDIIEEYNLDGIDVNYSHIKGSEDDFAFCIGELIKRLKESTEEGKFFASITVSQSVQADYFSLYNKYKHYIDYVGYQFYAESDSIETVKKLRELFTDVTDVFSISKLIAGFSSQKDEEEKLSEHVFFKGSEEFKAENILGGIVIWSADESKPDFKYERRAQDLLQAYKAAVPIAEAVSASHEVN